MRFCEMHWQTPVILMGLVAVATFALGLHVWRDRVKTGTDLRTSSNQPKGGPPLGISVAQRIPAGGKADAGQTVVSIIVGGSTAARGSGVIIHPDGYVLTALHLVNDRRDIRVQACTSAGLQTFKAEMVKEAPSHDLILLKVLSRQAFPCLEMGDSRTLHRGQQVFAFGQDARTGLISQPGRIGRVNSSLNMVGLAMGNLVETDAVNFWAQAGGPLINRSGQMIGLNIPVRDPAGRLRGYAVPAHVVFAHFQDVIDLARVGASTAGGTAGPKQDRPDNSTVGQAAARPVGLATNSAPPRALNALLVGLTDHTTGMTLWGYPMRTAMGLLLLGFVSGVSGGMMTMGGGLIKITGLMLLYGYGIILIRPVAYISNIFIYGAAALRYRRDQLIVMDKVKPLVPWAIGGVILGYFAGTAMSDTVIRYLLASFAVLMGFKVLFEMATGRQEDSGCGPVRGREWAKTSDPGCGSGILGLPMGLISGILGITGGVVEVPLQNYVALVPLRNAIANCAVLVFCTSTVASVLAMSHGIMSGAFTLETPLVLTAMLLPGAFLGGLFGAWLTKKAPFNVLRGLYALLMFAMALKMFWQS